MYRLILVLFTCFSSVISYGQATFGWDMFDNFSLFTEGKERFQISYSNEKGNYEIFFTHITYENGYDSSWIISDLGGFKQDLKELQSKYISWIEIANNNDVKTVEKEIPCSISFRTGSCSNIAYPMSIEVKPYFVVESGKPRCEVRVWQYWQYEDRSERNYHCWRLLPNDIPFILSAIDQSFKEYLERKQKKQQTEDLFH